MSLPVVQVNGEISPTVDKYLYKIYIGAHANVLWERHPADCRSMQHSRSRENPNPRPTPSGNMAEMKKKPASKKLICWRSEEAFITKLTHA